MGRSSMQGDPAAFYAPLPPQRSSTASESRPQTATPPFPLAPSDSTATLDLGPPGSDAHRLSHGSSHASGGGHQLPETAAEDDGVAHAVHAKDGPPAPPAEAAPVLVSTSTSTDFASQRRVSAAIQVAHPPRSVATSQTPQLPQVLQMNSGIQTYIPKAGVGVQVQQTSQSATTQTGETQLVLNGTQTTPRSTPHSTPRGRADHHHHLLPLLAQSLEHAQAQGQGAVGNMAQEAQELELLSEQVRTLRDQYVLREEAHRTELAEERQRLLLERQEMEKGYLSQLEAQTRELQRQVDLLTEEKETSHQNAVAEIVELQKIIEVDCFKITSMASELEAATAKIDAQLLDLQRSSDTVRSLETQLEAERSGHRRTTQDWQASQEQLTTCKLLLKEYKSRPSPSDNTEVIGLRQQLAEAEAEGRQLALRLTQATFEKTQEVDRSQKLEEELRRLMDTQVNQQQKEAKLTKLRLEAEADNTRLTGELKAVEEQKSSLETEAASLRNLVESQKEQLLQLQGETEHLQPLLAEKDLLIHRLNEALQKAKRDLLAREEHYSAVDGDNASLRRENRLLREETERGRNALQEWKTRCEELEALCSTRQVATELHECAKRCVEVEASHTQLDQVVHTNMKVATKLENLMRLLPATQLPQSPFASHISPPP
eukprot:GGOE01014378.1.p1 GENE.GGOE01014378.1~~GGOE01014378.1.p1  ORF type:complete len:743 (-),score=214.39 GGOE01014378.1:278-2254(-)